MIQKGLQESFSVRVSNGKASLSGLGTDWLTPSARTQGKALVYDPLSAPIGTVAALVNDQLTITLPSLAAAKTDGAAWNWAMKQIMKDASFMVSDAAGNDVLSLVAHGDASALVSLVSQYKQAGGR
jgi:hypothetical protein